MKIEKAIIIRREADSEAAKLSREYAKFCADSCDKYNLPWEYLKAVEDHPPRDAYKFVGVEVHHSPNKGNANCHASHILAWKRIVELGVACVVLEHDAVMKASLDKLDVEEGQLVTLGLRVLNLDDYEPIAEPTKVVPIKRSIGAHAYVLTPKDANYLYDHAIRKGVTCGVDRWLMMKNNCGVKLHIADPPPAVCWDRPSTMPERKGKTYAAANYNEAKIDSWNKGFKGSK